MLVRHVRGLSSGCDIEVTYTEDEANANLYTKAVAAGWEDGCNLLCTINSGVDLYSENSTPGFQISHTGTDMGFTSGTEITIINNGNIWGSSGTGGSAGTASDQAGGAGGAGGTAVRIKQTDSSGTLDGVTINFTNNGSIKGGGGGGGGGGAGEDYQSSYSCTTWEPSSGYNFVKVGGNIDTGVRTAGCDTGSCGSGTVYIGWDNGATAGSPGAWLSTQTMNICGCPSPYTGGLTVSGYTYYSASGTSSVSHHMIKDTHFGCWYDFAVKRSSSSTCYTQHYHGDGGAGGIGADWNTSAASGSGGTAGSPNGNGTEDGAGGGTGGGHGSVGSSGGTGGGGAAGGAGGAAGYYINYNVGNTSGWIFNNLGSVAGQIG